MTFIYKLVDLIINHSDQESQHFAYNVTDCNHINHLISFHFDKQTTWSKYKTVSTRWTKMADQNGKHVRFSLIPILEVILRYDICFNRCGLEISLI